MVTVTLHGGTFLIAAHWELQRLFLLTVLEFMSQMMEKRRNVTVLCMLKEIYIFIMKEMM